MRGRRPLSYTELHAAIPGHNIPRVNKYYILKRGSEYRTIRIDAATAELWVKAGWELGKHVYESQYEALLANRALEGCR